MSVETLKSTELPQANNLELIKKIIEQSNSEGFISRKTLRDLCRTEREFYYYQSAITGKFPGIATKTAQGIQLNEAGLKFKKLTFNNFCFEFHERLKSVFTFYDLLSETAEDKKAFIKMLADDFNVRTKTAIRRWECLKSWISQMKEGIEKFALEQQQNALMEIKRKERAKRLEERPQTKGIPTTFAGMDAALLEHGFECIRIQSSHYHYENKTNGRRVSVPHHTKEIKRGTRYSIIKKAGLSNYYI